MIPRRLLGGWPILWACSAPWTSTPFRSGFPFDLAYVKGRDLVLALYPSGLLMRGRADALPSAAQGLIVEGVRDLEVVWQISDPRAQEIE
jgi:hypothetical protein